MGFSYSNWPQNWPKKNRHRSCNKKERSCAITDIAFPFDHRVKRKRWSLCGAVSSFSAWRAGTYFVEQPGWVLLLQRCCACTNRHWFPRNSQQEIPSVFKESRTWPKYAAIKILFTGKILAVFLKERWWTPKVTGGHMVPGNDLVGRPKKTVRMTILLLLLLLTNNNY